MYADYLRLFYQYPSMPWWIAVLEHGSYQFDFTQGPKDQFKWSRCPNHLTVYSRHKPGQGVAYSSTEMTAHSHVLVLISVKDSDLSEKCVC